MFSDLPGSPDTPYTERVAQRHAGMHPATWAVWTIVVAAVTMLTHNPLYLLLLLGVVAIHYPPASGRRPEARGWGALLRIAVSLALLVIPFNALNAHAGRHVLFRLPTNWPLIGGNITLEGVLWGTTTALSLVTLLVLFATFNLRVTQAQILHLTPAFVYEMGLIVSIALAFVPQMIRSAQEIRDAQRIRGHRMRQLRDLRPFVMALLTTGLERSVQLAESMEARGFGNARDLPRVRDVVYKVLTLLALAGILSGFFLLTYFQTLSLWGWIGGLLSVALLIALFWAQGQRVLRTHYRRERMAWPDGAVLLPTLLTLAFLIWARIGDPAALTYYPYVDLLPRFEVGIGAAMLALAWPAILEAMRPGGGH